MKLSQIINVAYLEAKKAHEKNEVPVAAVVFSENKIISKAHNLVISSKDPLAHAEILALKKASKKLNTPYLNNLKIYSTLEPCIFCSFAISKYLINSLYFGLYDSNNCEINEGTKIFSKNFKGHKPDIYGGIGEERFSHLFDSFFEKLRKKS